MNDATIINFEFGGKVLITPEGGSEAELLHVRSGTVSYQDVYRPPIVDTDRGVLETDVRQGDQQPGIVDMDIDYTAAVGSTELEELLVDDGDDNSKPKFGIVLEWYSDEAQTTGKRITIADAYSREAPTVSAGGETDSMSARFGFPTKIVRAAITPA